ncbi:MAG: TonB-dependent receptor plug domain-containing protein, partial [Bacteroidota bacterium]|nr:TonB-dependent receptor plug domain-containing protein [Bacteroidota bacterium]
MVKILLLKTWYFLFIPIGNIILPSIFLMVLINYSAYGQELIVEGTVTEEDGGSLPGVNITIKGTSSGTVTDIEGNYVLTVPNSEAVLVFSFVGFSSQEIVVGNRNRIDVQLNADVRALSEVVVIGYGTVRKSDLTGSVSSVKGDELVKVPAVNPMQALQGKVAGVQISSLSGAPGQNPVVRVRGVGTLNNASPIYVVDGVIVNDINFLNAADIQSMEVLKDASATAIYGSRGANGVILVTTKSGQKGKEAVFSYIGEYSIQEVAKKIDLLNGREFAT